METSLPGSRCVWLVEDDDQLRPIVAGLLQRDGYTVLVERPSRDSIDRLIAEPFDIVVTDILMPSVDGIELIRRIGAAKPSVGIVAISGGGAELDAVAALNVSLAVGAAEILYKPFTGEELLDAVHKVDSTR